MAKTRGDTPTISGHLGTIGVQDVMGFLTTLHHGGALEIDSPDGELVLYLEGGAVVGGHVKRGGVDTTALLLSRGRIRTEDLDGVRDTAPDQLQRHDLLTALVAAGRLESDQVEELAAEELFENLLRLFAWTPGEFRFYEGRTPPPEVRPVRIEIPGLLLEGARRCDEWSGLPGIYADPDTRFELRSEPRHEESLALDLDEWKLLFLVTNRRRLAEIWEASSLGSRFETSRTLFGLASARLVQPTGTSNEESGSQALPAAARNHELPPPPKLRLADRQRHSAGVVSLSKDHEADTQPVVTRDDDVSPPRSVRLNPALAPRRLTRSQIRIERTPCLVQLIPGHEPPVFPLAGEKVSLGRSADNNLILSDGHVSGHHARLVRERDLFEIEDTQSSNGIRVDGLSVTRAPLKGGEEIEIYPYRFRFEVSFEISESK